MKMTKRLWLLLGGWLLEVIAFLAFALAADGKLPAILGYSSAVLFECVALVLLGFARRKKLNT
jgi:hypothetical protein